MKDIELMKDNELLKDKIGGHKINKEILLDIESAKDKVQDIGKYIL